MRNGSTAKRARRLEPLKSILQESARRRPAEENRRRATPTGGAGILPLQALPTHAPKLCSGLLCETVEKDLGEFSPTRPVLP